MPESVKLDVLFQNMKKSKNSFAIVLDEYGGTTGIITINDLVEQLVGDFDYDDSNEPRTVESIESLDSKTWKITGNPPIDDIEEALNVSFKTEDCDTFSGLVFDALGSVPDDGSTFEIETAGLVIKVLSVKNHQVQTAIVGKAAREKTQKSATENDGSENSKE